MSFRYSQNVLKMISCLLGVVGLMGTSGRNMKRESWNVSGWIFWSWHMIMCRLRIQKIKIGRLGGFEKIDFFSFFLMRKRLSSGQKWFLRPYFPLIRGMFVFRSVLRFSFGALQVPEPRVRKRSENGHSTIRFDGFWWLSTMGQTMQCWHTIAPV